MAVTFKGLIKVIIFVYVLNIKIEQKKKIYIYSSFNYLLEYNWKGLNYTYWYEINAVKPSNLIIAKT